MSITDNVMVFGDYEWRFNPSKCAWSSERDIIKHKYPELSIVELEDLNASGAIIYGTGEFFGPTAYADFMRLREVFNAGGIKKFYHPIFTDVTLAAFKKLEGSLEPFENYVSYSFEFWQHVPNVTKVNTVTVTSSTSTSLKIGSKGQDVINLQKALVAKGFKLPIYGIDGSYGTETANAVKAFQSSVGLPVTGIADSATLAKLGVIISPTITSTKSDIVYIVKTGDTLSRICAKYGADWREVAKYNSLKDPNLIYPGQKITIKA